MTARLEQGGGFGEEKNHIHTCHMRGKVFDGGNKHQKKTIKYDVGFHFEKLFLTQKKSSRPV